MSEDINAQIAALAAQQAQIRQELAGRTVRSALEGKVRPELLDAAVENAVHAHKVTDSEGAAAWMRSPSAAVFLQAPKAASAPKGPPLDAKGQPRKETTMQKTVRQLGELHDKHRQSGR